jgi:ArsR family transcriptional regulator
MFNLGSPLRRQLMDATRDEERRADGVPPEVPFEDAADVLRALAHPVRLRIVDLLASGELCVKRLEQLLGVSQSSVSQHLSRLRYAGLIESERRGHLVCYRLAGPGAEGILRAVARGLGSAEKTPRRGAGSVGAGSSDTDGEPARPSDA